MGHQTLRVDYINPFIESLSNVFNTMLGSDVERGDVGFSLGDIDVREFTAIIGLSGPVTGTVALSIPLKTSLRITSAMLGREVVIVDETIYDALGEVVNMVAGGAKSLLPREGKTPIDLTLPIVIRGSDYNVNYPSQAMWLEVPFTSDHGTMSLRVSLKETPAPAAVGDDTNGAE